MEYALPDNWDRNVLETVLEEATFRRVTDAECEEFQCPGRNALIAEVPSEGVSIVLDSGYFHVLGIDAASKQMFEIVFAQEGDGEGTRIV